MIIRTLHSTLPYDYRALMASLLIPLNKIEDAVRPIGVVEVKTRNYGKCVMSVGKKDVNPTVC